MLRTLKNLCLLNGVSGSEEEVREYIKSQALKYTDDVKTDLMGNLIVVKHAGNGGTTADASCDSQKCTADNCDATACAADRLPKLMIAAHMDEVGFMVCDITNEGYLKFEPVGGIDPRVVFNRRVWVGAKRIPGVTGLTAIHQTPEEQRSEIPGWTSMYIDIGARTREEAAALVEVGDPIAFYSDFARFGKGRGFIKAKAIDDRFGCAVMLKLLERTCQWT